MSLNLVPADEGKAREALFLAHAPIWQSCVGSVVVFCVASVYPQRCCGVSRKFVRQGRRRRSGRRTDLPVESLWLSTGDGKRRVHVARRILLVDDEQAWLDILALRFSESGWQTDIASGGEEACRILLEKSFDVILCDMSMPGMDGVELLQRLRISGISTPFIIMTGVGTIQSAVRATRLGAYDYVTKPLKMKTLLPLVLRAADYGSMQRSLGSSRREEEEGVPSMILGDSPAMHDIMRMLDKISGSSVSVLIEGRSGTGKSLLAKVIHASSPRRNKAFLTIDCGALPESLLDSELFGHVRGAFTGAVQSRRGLLEEAQGGTVFLDEIGEMPLGMQTKLLHAIQEREVRPVGANASVHIDVRFISASNRDLKEAVRQGLFREDLYYRLAVLPIRMPDLRERKEDIIRFIEYFIHKYNRKHNKNIREISPATLEILMAQPWPGNIRELENTMERIVLFTEGQIITPSSLGPLENRLGSEPRPQPLSSAPIALHEAAREAERKAILLALTLADGNRTRAATMLGVSRRTLYHKMADCGIPSAGEAIPKEEDPE